MLSGFFLTILYSMGPSIMWSSLISVKKRSAEFSLSFLLSGVAIEEVVLTGGTMADIPAMAICLTSFSSWAHFAGMALGVSRCSQSRSLSNPAFIRSESSLVCITYSTVLTLLFCNFSLVDGFLLLALESTSFTNRLNCVYILHLCMV